MESMNLYFPDVLFVHGNCVRDLLDLCTVKKFPFYITGAADRNTWILENLSLSPCLLVHATRTM
jgi:hypothetical protein